jgi:4-hydroxy-tetrahydrodipicolinate synthase
LCCMSLRDLLKGTGVALVTPFNEKGTVDLDALHRLINFVIEGGVDYVVTLGTTGESVVLSREEKQEVVSHTFTAVAARVPVVIGIGGNDTRSVIREMESLPVEKAAAVLSVSPYYNKPSQEGIYQHYRALASTTAHPIILYNVPGRSGSNIAPSTVLRLAADCSNINGIKEASGNMNQCMELLRDKPEDFMVVSGDDNLAMAQIACGMDGVISVAANCFPKLFSQMIRCALEGEFVRARGYNNKLLEGYEILFAENNPAGAKAFLAEMGLIANHLRLPLVPLSEGVAQRVTDYLTRLK